MPRKEHARITIAGIDYDSLAESEESHEAIEFDVLLNEAPEEKWHEEFTIAYRTLPNNIKPPVRLEGDRLRIAFLPRYANDIQSYFEFLKSVMDRADVEMRKTEAIARHGHQQEHIDAFRDVLRRVRLNAG